MKTFKWLPLALGFLLLNCPLQAQNSKQAKKALDAYNELRSGKDSLLTDSLISLADKVFNEETSLKQENRDTVFLAGFCRKMGDYLIDKTYYKRGGFYALKAAEFYRAQKKTKEAGECLSRYLAAYEFFFHTKTKFANDSRLDTGFFRAQIADTSVWLSTRAVRVKPSGRSRDTIYVTIQAGRMQHVIKGGRLDVFTTFDTFKSIDRKSMLAARGRITTVFDHTSNGFVVRENGFRDTLFENDAWTVQVRANKAACRTVLSSMAQNNIKIRDHQKSKYFIQGPGNLTLQATAWDDVLIESLLRELHDAEAYYTAWRPDLFSEKVKEGRFAGYTYREVINASTLFDVRAFLDFVNSFPARYINRYYTDDYGYERTGWSFVEVYLTWVINDCVNGNNEQMILEKLLSLSSEEMKARPAVWKGYYRSLTNADSQIVAFVYNRFPDEPVRRMEIFGKMRAFATITGLGKTYDYFTQRVMWAHFSANEYDKMIPLCDELLQRLTDLNERKVTYFYKGAALNGKEKPADAIIYYDSALLIDPGFYWASGQKGWALTKMMNLTEAMPMCKKAFEADSLATWTVINLGHVYLLQGDRNEAYRLYDKALANSTSESDFYTGMIGDFNYFLKKGVQVREFTSIKQELTGKFVAKYLHKLRSDSLFERAASFRNNKRYAEAIVLYRQSLEEEMKVEPRRWEQIRLKNRWVAYTHYRNKDYKQSLAFYQAAAEVSVTRGLGEDMIISDYDDIGNLYNLLGDTIRELEFQARKTAIQTALDEKREKRRLFAVVAACGTNGKNDRKADQDARDFIQTLNSGSSLQFESSNTQLLLTENCTPARLIQAIDTVIMKAREHDVFIFYFAGHATRDLKSEKLVLNGGQMDFQTLVNSLALVSAGKQLHVADCNALSWRDWYTRKNFPALNNASKSLVFMGYKSVRIEEAAESNSVLTKALLSSYQSNATTGVVSAVSWLSEAMVNLSGNQLLYPMELLSYGHDFSVGRHKVRLEGLDKIPPVIDLPGARKTRGENISLVSRQSARSGTITDQSRVVVATANGIPLMLASTGRFEMPSELSGAEKVIIYAKDEFGNEASESFQILKQDNPVSSEGTKYAYLIASDQYKYWSPLSNPVFDAVAIGNILREYYGYKVEIDSNLSQEQILEKLDQIRRTPYKAKDQLFVFIAGHGVYDSIRQGSYVCVDSRPLKEDRFFSSYIKHKDIVEYLDGTSCKNVFMVMDVCFGGKMFDKQETRRALWINDGYSKSADEYIQQQLDIPCRQFLTSGGNNYVSDGTPGAHSPFASRFIKALEDGTTDPAKSFVTASEIMDYLRTMRTVGNDLRSYPRFGSFGGSENGEFVLPVVKKMLAPGKAASDKEAN